VVARIIEGSENLKALLSARYRVKTGEVVSVWLDRIGTRLVVLTKGMMLPFTVKDANTITIQNPTTGGTELTLDPALARDLLDILSRFDI